MIWYEYIATKSELPARLDKVHTGFIDAKTEITARHKLEKHYNNVLIVRMVK